MSRLITFEEAGGEADVRERRRRRRRDILDLRCIMLCELVYHAWYEDLGINADTLHQ